MIFFRRCGLLVVLLSLFTTSVTADELVLVERGRQSPYQIVIPDPSSDPVLDTSLEQTARLVQTAFKVASEFKAVSVELPIVVEAERDLQAPGIYLGDTQRARSAGVDVTQLEGWSYVHKVVGQDIVIAGRDHAPPNINVPNLGSTAWFSYRLGTLKATTDFLRTYTRTFFLFQGAQHIPTQQSKSLAPWRLDTVDIEFGRPKQIAVPADLDLHKAVFTRTHTRRRTAVLYDIANNFFPKVDDAALGHTWDRAIPVSQYREEHPEYFALLGGERTREGQYCLSNPQVRELIYQFTKRVLDQGCQSVNILEPDGFRPCQCKPCHDLYGTEGDWGEKLWIFYRNVAERIEKDCPGKQLMITSYALTRYPPKTFDTFPENVVIQTVDAISHPTEHFLAWTRVHHGEFGCWLHNWVTLWTTRYTPARTPLFVSDQARFFHEYKVRSVFRDGIGEVYGLEGPTYYIFGRMFDDPANTQAKDLMYEYCGAAFSHAGGYMRQFYDRLNRAIELYSQYLGTHGIGWNGDTIYGGHGGKYIRDPYRLMGFLYTPALIKDMEADLSAAERKMPQSQRVAQRLALVRREFDYLKHFVTIVHLYQAYEMAPTLALREQVLDAVDARNAMILAYYQQDRPGRPKPMPGWGEVLFPPPGHDFLHLRLNYDRYQESFSDTVFNWDTQAVRKTALPGSKCLAAAPATGGVTINDPSWQDAPAAHAGKATTFRVKYDAAACYVQFETDIADPKAAIENLGADADLSNHESFDVYLAPVPGRELFYRFTVGPDSQTRFDSASGLITDMMNLRYGKDDPTWNGDWRYESHVDRETGRWVGMLVVPFTTLGTEAPQTGATWKFNAGRVRVLPSNQIERHTWSTVGTTQDPSNRNALGTLAFDMANENDAVSEVTQWREKYYKETFRVPAEWTQLPNVIDNAFGPWRFRADVLERGLDEKWYAPETDHDTWSDIVVPAFWDEGSTGQYEGYGWYRTTFDVPPAWKGHPLRLLFAGVDEQGWVYVNGQLVGEQTTASTGVAYGSLWDKPFAVDVPADQLNANGSNTLVVRVHNAKAGGGIWRPVILQGIDK